MSIDNKPALDEKTPRLSHVEIAKQFLSWRATPLIEGNYKRTRPPEADVPPSSASSGRE